MTKPFRFWLGSKKWAVDTVRPIVELFPQSRFVELFAGSAAVSFELELKNVMLVDINIHLIQTYQCIKNEWLAAAETLNKVTGEREEYYSVRDKFNGKSGGPFGTQLFVSERFLYLTLFGYRGLIRFNQSGHWNVPYGQRPTTYAKFAEMWPSKKQLNEYAQLMEQWELLCASFNDSAVWNAVKPSDILYVDPPYVNGFTAYFGQKFTDTHQQWLINKLADHPGPVIYHNHADESLAASLIALGFDIKYVDVQQNMRRGQKIGSNARELIALRNIPPIKTFF